MTGNYKIYRIGPNYQSLKDQIIKAWRFYFIPIGNYMFTEIPPKSRYECCNKHYISSQMHRLRRLEKGQALNKLPVSSEQEFHSNGQSPSNLNHNIISHIFCCWCTRNDLVCHLRVWKICKACKLKSVSWGSA